MAQPKQQTFRNHASFDPLFHAVAALFLLISLVTLIVFLVLHFKAEPVLSLWMISSFIVFAITLFKSRLYPLKTQDRIIRLEERLRLQSLLPEALRKRIPELTEDQLIGLRFASDDELPTLVEMTLDKKLDRRQIKERIQNWRADNWRI